MSVGTMEASKETKSLISVQVVENFAQFKQLKHEWDALTEDFVDTVFLTHDWLSTWWEHYGAGLDLLVWTARHSDRLVGVLPLVGQKTRFGIRRLLWMGFGEVTPNHLQAVLDPQHEEDCLQAITTFLTRIGWKYAYLDLEKIPPDTRFFAAMEQCLKDAGYYVMQKEISYSPYLEAQDFETYFQSRKIKVRSNYRRNQRRLEKDFSSVVYRRVETLADTDQALNALIDLHQTRFNQKGFNGAFFSKEMRAFHHNYSRRAHESGTLRMYLLSLEDKQIAVRYAFRTGKTLQFYLDSFDEKYQTYGPGILLLGYVIQQALEEGICKIDFLEGDEPYKRDWSTEVRDNVRLRAYSPHFRGKLVMTFHNLGDTLRSLALRYIPLSIRRPIHQLLKRWKLI